MTTIEPGIPFHPARWWRQERDAIQCRLCPHRCLVQEGTTGFCNARANDHGRLVSLVYGRVCVSAVDPIEKKPIFHFHPGAKLYSIGTFGCNLDCSFCQNSMLARAGISELPSKYTSPEDLVQFALNKEVDGIGWTFNEPTVWSEYIIDVSKLAHVQGLFSLLNTNGYIEPEAAEDLLENIDAVKVDIKGFGETIYNELCHGKLAPVLQTCIMVKEKGIHLELAYPLIPSKTDDPGILTRFAEWVIEELGRDTPVHLFRFQPSYRLTQIDSPTLSMLYESRRLLHDAGLRFIYLGGVTGEDQNTYCPSCGKAVVVRRSEEVSEKMFIKKEQVSRFCPTFSKVEKRMSNGRCKYCGESLPIRENELSGLN